MSLARSLVLGLACAAGLAHAEPRLLNLTLQTRDPKSNQVTLKTEKIDAAKVAVVIVDPWNYHWCMTACERVSAMVLRWNRALECARKVGLPILLLDHDSGRNLAMHCSVVFRVFIDGQLAAESPVMRISQEPWRFAVPIPSGSRFINLVCMDAGSRNVLDLGNWIEAGFIGAPP